MNTFSRMAGVAGVMTLLFSSVTAGALADGIASKDKSRVPQTAEITSRALPASRTPSEKEQEKIAALVRRNIRLQKRLSLIPNNAPKAVIIPKGQKTSDRERLIIQGTWKMPNACEALHTHERAKCIRDAQLAETLRVAGL